MLCTVVCALAVVLVASGRCQNSRVGNCYQLMWPLVNGLSLAPQENAIKQLECHIFSIMLMVC